MDAKRIVEAIAAEKTDKIAGGGSDFLGALNRLIKMWHDPSHALTELLQNADDCGASTATIRLLPHGVLFIHDGQPFTAEEVRALCSIDGSTKDPETQTGSMGIGFKSVYRFSRQPTIVNGPWRFRFDGEGAGSDDWGWTLIPRWVVELPPELRAIEPDQTAFWLPYASDVSPSTMKIVAGGASTLSRLTLLFLRSVRQLKIENEPYVRELVRDADSLRETLSDGPPEVQHYRAFKRTFRVPRELRESGELQRIKRDRAKEREVVLVFLLNSEGSLVATDEPLYNFLPTEYRPGLHFVVNGDFVLDSQRRDVDQGSSWNGWMWTNVLKSLQGAIEGYKAQESRIKGFKSHPKHKYEFYGVLPDPSDGGFGSESRLIRQHFLDPFWEYCRQAPIVATASRGWAVPGQVVQASEAIRSLIDRDKLVQETGRSRFSHRHLRSFRDWLEAMGAERLLDDEVLVFLQDASWLRKTVKTEGVEWFKRLYRFLENWALSTRTDWGRQHRQSEIRQLPIVLSDKCAVLKPARVLFQPTARLRPLARDIPGLRWVHGNLTRGTSGRFLKSIGVAAFDPDVAVENAILGSYEDETWKRWSERQRQRALRVLRKWLEERNWKTDEELDNRLGLVRLPVSNADDWFPAGQCYLADEQLTLLLPDATYVTSSAQTRRFLLALGVRTCPRVLTYKDCESGPDEADDWSTYGTWALARRPNRTGSWREARYDVAIIDGFDRISWTVEKGLIFLQLLADNWRYYEAYLETSYSYVPQTRRHYIKSPSYLRFQLEESRWMPTSLGLQAPRDQVFLRMPALRAEAWGDLVPILQAPPAENSNRILLSIASKLGLYHQMSLSAAAELLRIVSGAESTRVPREYVGIVYGFIARALAKEGAGEVVLSELRFLTTDRDFRPANEIYWGDDPDYSDFLGSSIPQAWLPDDIPRSELEQIFRAAGVRSLSESMTRALADREVVGQPNGYFDSVIRKRARYLASAIKHWQSEADVERLSELGEIQATEVVGLELDVSVDGQCERGPVNAFCDTSPLHLYTSECSNYDVALELCRAFDLPLDRASDIELQLKSNTSEIESRFARQGISIIKQSDLPLPPVTFGEGDEGVGSEELDGGKVSEDVNETDRGRETSTDGSRPGRGSGGTSPGRRGGRSGQRISRPVLPYGERMKREAEAIQRIIEFEGQNQRDASDVSREARGYDVESIHCVTGERRYIEVKSESVVQLTDNEHQKAGTFLEEYYLYVVAGDELKIVRDPVNRCRVKETERLETRHQIEKWREKAETYPLPPLPQSE